MSAVRMRVSAVRLMFSIRAVFLSGVPEIIAGERSGRGGGQPPPAQQDDQDDSGEKAADVRQVGHAAAVRQHAAAAEHVRIDDLQHDPEADDDVSGQLAEEDEKAQEDQVENLGARVEVDI